MATYKPLFASQAEVVINPDALSSAAARKSDAIDNTSTLYSDILITSKVKASNSALGTAPHVKIWVASLATGTNYADDVTSGDSAYTILTTKNLKLLDIVRVNAQNVTQYGSQKSVASLFGGILPPKFVIIFDNQTGVALAGSANQRVENVVYYTGVNFQSA